MSSEPVPLEETTTTPPNAFRPGNLQRWVAGLALVLAWVFAMFIPQQNPCGWWNLESRSPSPWNVVITCAASAPGHSLILLDEGKGFEEAAKIEWSNSGANKPVTHTLPLPDAPLRALRLAPLDRPGQLAIDDFRLTDAKGNELRRFTKEDLHSPRTISAIARTENGCTIAEDGGAGSYADIEFGHFAAPDGMIERNAQLCLAAVGIVALVVLVPSIVAWFAFSRPVTWRRFGKAASLLVLVAGLFACFANRTLVRNSIRYALTAVPAKSAELRLEIDVNSAHPAMAQLFWDVGKGFDEPDSSRAYLENTTGLQTLRYNLPSSPLLALRFDPLDGAGTLTIRRMRLVDGNGDVRATFEPWLFEPRNQIAKIEREKAEVDQTPLLGAVVETTPGATDPILAVGARVVNTVNALRGRKPSR